MNALKHPQRVLDFTFKNKEGKIERHTGRLILVTGFTRHGLGRKKPRRGWVEHDRKYRLGHVGLHEAMAHIGKRNRRKKVDSAS